MTKNEDQKLEWERKLLQDLDAKREEWERDKLTVSDPELIELQEARNDATINCLEVLRDQLQDLSIDDRTVCEMASDSHYHYAEIGNTELAQLTNEIAEQLAHHESEQAVLIGKIDQVIARIRAE